MPSRFDREEIIGYYRALGEFVDAFANVEWALFLYLHNLAGIDENIAKAIFSGVRVHDAVSFIRRMAEVGAIGLSTETNEVLSQVLIINDLRNLILHHPVSGIFNGSRFTRHISNFDRALTKQRIREIPISEDILMKVSHDLEKITTFLFREQASWFPDGGAVEEIDPIPLGAWLYKPAQQSKKATPAPRSRRARRIPPGGSSRR